MPEPDPEAMAPHSRGCMGCGPDNPAGLHLEVRRVGNEVVTDVVFDHRHLGAPGLAHGGAVAAACDDLFGFVLFVVGAPAVTRSLTVEYRSPVRLGERLRVTAGMERRKGRKLYLVAEGVAADGAVRFTATALFVVVDIAHFERFGVLPQHPGWSGGRAGTGSNA